MITTFKKTFQKLIFKKDNYIFLIFMIFNLLILLKVVGSGALLTVFIFTVFALLINLKIKNLTVSFLLITIYTMQFYVPNKYYVVEVFKPNDLILGFGNYLLSYGVNLQNIFLLITITLTLRNFIIKKWIITSKTIFKILFLLISSAIFFTVSTYSSTRFSPYVFLSTVWLMQYMSMFVIAFIFVLIFENEKEQLRLIFPLILSSLFLQSVIAVVQFLKQSWIGLPVESYKAGMAYYGSADAINGFFRVVGTFGHANQFALILCIMISIIAPYALAKKRVEYILGSLMGVFAIIVSQSRSGWLGLFIISILTIAIYKHYIKDLIYKVGLIKFYLFVLFIIVGTSFVVFPRINASYNSFSDDAGATLRLEMEKEAINTIAKRPFTGYGIGTNEPTLLFYFPRGYVYTFPAPIHMFYLQLILESGLTGLFAFLFPFFYIFRYIIVTARKQKVNLTKFKSVANYIFIAGFLSAITYYIFQPHQGFIEFPYLGLILGFGTISILESTKYEI